MLKLQLVVALSLAVLFAASCGGSVQGLADKDLAEDKGFTALRVNSDGQGDPTLSDSVSIEVESRGGRTYVRVSVDDRMPTQDVMVHLEFDETRYSPVSSEFTGLVENCLELAITDVMGLVALGQSSFDPALKYRGSFAEVVFENRPMMRVRRASAVHSDLVNTVYGPPQISSAQPGFEITKSMADDGDPATFTIYSIFATADGDDNGETNLSDITPMVSYQNITKSVSDSNIGPAATDYDANGEANLSDISEIAIHFQRSYTLGGVEILLGDSQTLGDPDLLRELAFASGTPANHLPSPFTTTDWAAVYRTWNDSITIEEMEAADTNEDGTVYVSARVTDGTEQGDSFTGLALTYEIGPPVITNIDLSFPGAETWAQDPPGSGNYLVLITEKSVDGTEDNSEPFAPEIIGVEATVTIEGEVDPVQDNALVLWNVIDGAGLGNVDNVFEKGKVTFTDRGRLIVQAQAIGDFGVTGEITFLLCSIDSLALTVSGGGVGPENVNSGDTVQFTATGTFDWDSVDNGNEVDEDITSACNWASLAEGTNTGSFVFFSDTGLLNTTSADSGDSTRITCEFPGTDNVTIYDNMKRASNFVTVNIN